MDRASAAASEKAVKSFALVPILFWLACGSSNESGSLQGSCGLCQVKSLTCGGSMSQEAATMTIAPRTVGSCTATLPGVTYEMRCGEDVMCLGADCVPLTFDGRVLQFDHFDNLVTCGVNAQP
jgi:hypothetical protein